jgi:hypothetical protein
VDRFSPAITLKTNAQITIDSSPIGLNKRRSESLKRMDGVN